MKLNKNFNLVIGPPFVGKSTFILQMLGSNFKKVYDETTKKFYLEKTNSNLKIPQNHAKKGSCLPPEIYQNFIEVSL